MVTDSKEFAAVFDIIAMMATSVMGRALSEEQISDSFSDIKKVLAYAHHEEKVLLPIIENFKEVAIAIRKGEA